MSRFISSLVFVALLPLVTAPTAGAHLVVNEVDYDQIGTDTTEFVELLNKGTNAINLSHYALAFINGANNLEYLRVALNGFISSGQYLVVASTNLSGIAGPTIAGVLVATVGSGWAILGDSASFLVAAVLLQRLDTVERGRASAGTGFWTEYYVSRGAAYYGLARRGSGVRIGSGAARTYYLGLQEDRLLCIVPRGMEEGETVDLAARELELVANRPVAFPLFTATDRTGETAGELVDAPPDALTALPPLHTVVRFGRKVEERALPVHLEGETG